MTLSRRRLLARAGAAVAGAAAAGLTGAPALGRRPRATLQRLARQLRGPLVVPGDSGYGAARAAVERPPGRAAARDRLLRDPCATSPA